MIVRELITRFGIDFDDSGAKKVESSLSGLKSFAMKVGAAISVSAIASGLYNMVELAAEAADNLSLLKTTFGASAEAVTKWADEQGDALGRSRYAMRKYATDLGLVTKGLTGSEKDAEKVATTFGKLAVDMKAFFGKSDEENLNALRSALTGETEPMKKYGVVMDEAALASFSLSQGQRTLWKDMTAAQKTMVRFNFIMANANIKDAWGAAGREAETFAARVERLKNKASELSTDLGGKLLPAAQKLLDIFEKLAPAAGLAADAIGFVAQETYVFEGAMLIAALIGGAKFIGMLINLYRAIRTRVLLSVISLATSIGALPATFAAASTAMKAFLVAAAPFLLWGVIIAAIGAAVYALWQQFTTGRNFIADFLEDWIGLETALVNSMLAVDKWFRETWDKISGYVSGALATIRQKLAEMLPEGVLNLLAKVGLDLHGAQQNAGARTAGGTVAPGSTVSSRNVNVTNGAVTVNIQGGATPATAQAVGREVQKALDNNNRNLAAAAPL